MSTGTGTVGASWDTVVGQSTAVRVLRAALRADRVAHAWLFVGRPGVGQGAAVRALAAALNCPESEDPSAGCGRCSTCRRIGRRVHPDVRDLEPEGASHRVGVVREEWIPAATTTPVEAATKVLRVVEADRMNETAQNAFLKILEEPPPLTVWILEVEDEGLLLETVTSRCRRVDFTAPDLSALRELAGRAGVAADRRRALARAAMGSSARLEALIAQGEEPLERHRGLLARLVREGPGCVPGVASELRSWAKEQAAPLEERHEREWTELLDAYGAEARGELPPGVAPRLEKRHHRERRQARTEALVQVLDDLSGWLRDLLAVAGGAGAEGLINIEREAGLRQDLGRLEPDGAIRGLRAVRRAREALDRNGHQQLQLEWLLLDLTIELYRRR